LKIWEYGGAGDESDWSKTWSLLGTMSLMKELNKLFQINKSSMCIIEYVLIYIIIINIVLISIRWNSRDFH
jgi:hypothetical protein